MTSARHIIAADQAALLRARRARWARSALLLRGAMGYDIHGNPDNLDIHGNRDDRDIHGNRARDIHGNEWDRPLIGPPGFGGSPSASWDSGSGGSGDAGLASGGVGGRRTGSGSSNVTPAIGLLALIGMAMFAAGAAGAYLGARPYGIHPIDVLLAGCAVFLIAMFPKIAGLVGLVAALSALKVAGGTPDGFVLGTVPALALVAAGVGILLSLGLIIAAIRPARTRAGHRALNALVVVPVAALTTLVLVDGPPPARASSPASAGRYAVVTAAELNMRTTPSSSGARVGTLHRRDTVQVVGPAGDGWVAVRHARGRGYVAAKHLSQVPAPDIGDRRSP